MGFSAQIMGLSLRSSRWVSRTGGQRCKQVGRYGSESVWKCSSACSYYLNKKQSHQNVKGEKVMGS